MEINQKYLTLILIPNSFFPGARTEDYVPWEGIDDDPIIFFKAKDPMKTEGDYLVKGKNRVFDKSKYQNVFFKPSGKPRIGYDFYGRHGVRYALGG